MELVLPSLVAKLAAVVDLEQSARACKALQRKRKVASAVDLLKLIFLYALGGLSLRTTAAVAAGLQIATLENTAVLHRLRQAAGWLEHLLLALLNRCLASPPLPGLERTLAIVDGTSLSRRRSPGTDWRLHLRFDPALGRFAELQLSDGRAPESPANFAIGARDLLIGDRGYAKAQALARLVAAGGDFIVRIGWAALPLRQPDGQPLDLMALLRRIDRDRPVEWAVQVAHNARARQTFPARLLIVRKPAAAGARAVSKAQHKGRRQKRRTKPQTLLAAQFLILLTSLPASGYRPELVLALYRLRWQVELAIKRLKSLLGLADIPAHAPDLARTWLLAHLLTALLIDDLASPSLAFSPSAAAGEPSDGVALAAPADRLQPALA